MAQAWAVPASGVEVLVPLALKRYSKAARSLLGQHSGVQAAYSQGMAFLRLQDEEGMPIEEYNEICDALLEDYDSELRSFERHYDSVCDLVWPERRTG